MPWSIARLLEQLTPFSSFFHILPNRIALSVDDSGSPRAPCLDPVRLDEPLDDWASNLLAASGNAEGDRVDFELP